MSLHGSAGRWRREAPAAGEAAPAWDPILGALGAGVMAMPLLPAWRVAAGVDVELVAQQTEEEFLPPDLRVVVLAQAADWLRVALLFGAEPLPRGSQLYVRGCGLYTVVGREEWTDGSVVLALAYRRRAAFRGRR